MTGYISIHAAREGGDAHLTRLIHVLPISIHAAREGGDPTGSATATTPRRFQSTPPVKAATAYACVTVHFKRISIHAAREGGDCM